MNQNNNYKKLFLFILFLTASYRQFAQEVPSLQQNIPFLVTFGLNSDHSLGDDDFSQTVFFILPKSQTVPVYLRIFDPETGGELDEVNQGWDTKMNYSVYGGNEAYSHKDARGTEPAGNYKSGVLLESRVFGSEATTDQKWITMGPFNPGQGEYVPELDGYVIKVVIDGMKGNDGNLYKLFLSTGKTENVAMEGARAFTYEYSVRMKMEAGSILHLYPFADNLITSFTIHCFDFDEDGQTKLYSEVKNGHLVKMGNDKDWSSSKHPIKEEEKNKCLDLQIMKKGNSRNDMVLYITNEYDVAVPLYTFPLGGTPRYKYNIKVTNIVKAK